MLDGLIIMLMGRFCKQQGVAGEWMQALNVFKSLYSTFKHYFSVIDSVTSMLVGNVYHHRRYVYDLTTQFRDSACCHAHGIFVIGVAHILLHGHCRHCCIAASIVCISSP